MEGHPEHLTAAADVSASRRDWAATAAPLWTALLIVALVELLAGRLLSRALIHLPHAGASVLLRPLVMSAGALSLNLVVLLPALALVVFPTPIWGPPAGRYGRFLQVARVAIAVLGLLSAVGSGPLAFWLLHAAVAAFVLVVAFGAGSRAPVALRAFLLLVVLSFLSAEGYLAATQLQLTLEHTRIRLPTIALFYAGEALCVAAVYSLGVAWLGPAQWWARGQRRRAMKRALVASLMITLFVGLAFTFAHVLVFQTALLGLGIAMFLPLPCYLFALFLLCAVSLEMIGQRGLSRQFGVGLVLMATAGYAPQVAVHRLLLWAAGFWLMLAPTLCYLGPGETRMREVV